MSTMCIRNEIPKEKLISFEIFDIASAAFITARKVSKYGFFLIRSLIGMNTGKNTDQKKLRIWIQHHLHA